VKLRQRLRHRGWLAWLLVGSALLAAVPPLSFAVYGQYRLERDLDRRGEETDGTVLRSFTVMTWRLPQHRLEVEFKDRAARTHRVEMPAGDEGRAPGDSVRVLYDPTDPGRALPVSWSRSNWAAGLVSAVALIIVGLFLVLIGLRQRRGRPYRRTRRVLRPSSA
jgi:hypothetical protein